MKIFLLVLFWATFGVIAYTYIVFPLLLKALTLFKGSRAEPATAASNEDSDLPQVTMVVAAYNEAAVMGAKLENTWQIDYPRHKFRIIVGSDGSDDDTNRLLGECTDSRLNAQIYTERRGKISVLNSVIALVDSDIVVMSDANTMYRPDAIRKLVAKFQNPKVGCVSGRLVIDQDGGVSGEGLYWKYENWIKNNESRLGFLIGCNGGIFAMRRELYSVLPQSTIIEDFVLTLRVLEQGYRVINEPAAIASEPSCESSRAEMVRKIRIGAGGWQALTLTSGLLHPRHGVCAFAFWGHKVLRWVVPMCMIVNMAATACLARIPFFAVVLALQVLGVLLSLPALNSSWESRLPKIIRPISYYYLMNYSLLLGFIRFVTKTQRVTWDKGTPQPPKALEQAHTGSQ